MYSVVSSSLTVSQNAMLALKGDAALGLLQQLLPPILLVSAMRCLGGGVRGLPAELVRQLALKVVTALDHPSGSGHMFVMGGLQHPHFLFLFFGHVSPAFAQTYLRRSVGGLAAELVRQLALKVVGALDCHQQLLHQARQLRSLHTDLFLSTVFEYSVWSHFSLCICFVFPTCWRKG